MHKALLFTVAVLFVAGCQRAENKPDNASLDSQPNLSPQPKVGRTDPEPPAPPQKLSPESVKEVLDGVAKFGGYENRFGKREGDPLHVQFRSPGPSEADLEAMRPTLLKSPVPIKMNLNGCASITNACVARLQGIGTIRVLQIESQQFTDDGMKHLAGHTQLEELSISAPVTDAGLTHISKLTNLKKLSIYPKNTTDAAYASLAGLVNLEELQLGGVGHELSDQCLQHMKGMTKLKALTLGQKVTDAGMAHVKNLVGLRELRIDNAKVTGAALANLAPLVKLQKLSIHHVTNQTGDSFAALEGMTELQELEVVSFTHPIDKVGMTHIGKLKGLKKFKPGRVTAGALEGLAGSTGLEELFLEGSPLGDSTVGDADMKSVGGLTSLRTLDLTQTRVTDEGIKQLGGLKNLETFIANNNNLTDASLPSIAMLTNLKRLGLTNCKITGSGLKDFSKLAKLESVWLNGNPITDEHVLEVKDTPILKFLSLTGSKVSDEVALELKKAKPRLELLDSAGDEVKLDAKPPQPKRPPAEDISKVEPAFKLTAEEFQKEFKGGRDQASAKYKGKVIELSGVVHSISRNDGVNSLTLKVENDLLGVTCVMADEYPWAKAVEGQKLKLKGKWPEMPFLASLTNCVFVETGEYMGIPITPTELAKEFAADPEATVKKYDGKRLVISGEVVSKEFNSAGAAGVLLKAESKVKVRCNFTAFDKDYTKPLKIGQKIKAVGQFTLNSGEKEEVTLYFCLPLASAPGG